MSRKELYQTRRFFRDMFPILGAILIASASVAYIIFRSWSIKKTDEEKWKDYEECGI